MSVRAIVALAAIFAIGLAACGGDDNGDGEAAGIREDPEAVVKAFYRARADCGREAAEQIYDLTTNPTGESREDFVSRQLRDERRDGCRLSGLRRCPRSSSIAAKTPPRLTSV